MRLKFAEHKPWEGTWIVAEIVIIRGLATIRAETDIAPNVKIRSRKSG